MDAQTTTRGHPDRAYGNIVRPTERPVDSSDEILFPAGMPRSRPRPHPGGKAHGIPHGRASAKFFSAFTRRCGKCGSKECDK
jgi:hypothetical protein